VDVRTHACRYEDHSFACLRPPGARYYIQNFGPAISHPDTDEYAAFLQDTIRVTHRLALSLGVRYDRQTFNTSELVSNPLWPQSGHVPVNDLNFAPRVGLAYSIGSERPLVIRAGYGVFYTRIPQIYLSAVTTDDGVNSLNLILDNMDYYGHQAFPKYPNPLVNRTPEAAYCVPPASLVNRLGTEISAFAPNFGTPRVEQASLNIERELADRIAAGVSYLYVHGENMIRARDVNLPLPADVTYPVYDETGSNFLGSYYDLPSFSTWQLTRSMTCPYPPCINPLVRPIPQLQAINQFESVASSVYNGATLSVRRRITHGLYFRLSYTYGRAVDDGQDALVAGRPAVVQNTYATASERGPSVTDQRNRVAFSWITDPKPFGREHDFLAKLFNDWKFSGVLTYGSVRPIDARVIGDPNQDGNSSNDRLPGYSRNSFIGPDYATADLRLTRRLFLTSRLKLDATAEVFNALNRDNQRVSITDDGFQIAQQEKTIGINTFPAYYQRPSNFLAATSSYSPRQIQLASRVTF
jgi:outer membrane receptor protein involved in Fe transport